MAAGMVFMALAGGCAAPAAKVTSGPLVLAGDSDLVWQVSQEELRKRAFELDRVDRRAGIIETFPRTSSQWFEFWGKDVVTARAAAEANLHTIRRRVRLEVRTIDAQQCELQCHVDVERLSLPPSSVSASVKTTSAFVASPMEIEKQQGIRWVDLGDDAALSAGILQAISESVLKDQAM